MELPSLKDHSNEKILSETKELKGDGSRADADLILRLAENDSRKIYREAGFSSLFAFCRSLGFSEGYAQQRIVAARCIKEHPEVYWMLREGSMTLCTLCEMRRVVTPENKAEVVPLFKGASKREAHQIAVSLGAPVKPKRDSVRAKKVLVSNGVSATQESPLPVAVEERFDLRVEMDRELKDLLDEAQRYGPSFQIRDVLKAALKAYVQPRRPKPASRMEGAAGPSAPKKSRVLSRSRYISRSVRDEVRIRDGEQCTYVAPDGRRCCERRRLQMDHIQPYALGGANTVQNLRLRCQQHNLLGAEEVFGHEFIQERRKKRQLTPG